MGTPQEDIKSILERYRLGIASEEDIAFLEDWYMRQDHTKDSVEEYNASALIEDADEVWRRLNRRTPAIYRFAKYAAAILLVISITFYIKWSQQKNRDLDIENIVAASGLQPTITLTDGTSIVLDAAQSGIQMGDRILYEDGSPVNGVANGTKHQELLIQIPAGSTYQITLSDHTKVWLNAGSSLRYPSNFDNDTRIVELKGEAYFEVNPQFQGNTAQLKKFVVKTDKQQIQVLGTHFNVKAYPYTAQLTTLLEGKVNVLSTEYNQSAMLRPGQEARFQGAKITVNQVDTEASVSWVSGLFSFDNKSFQEIMTEVCEWYDLKVIYNGPIPEETFFGQAYKTDNLSTVLRLLESAQIKYSVTGERELIITTKKDK